MTIQEKIEFLVEVIQKLDEKLEGTYKPATYMVARYALKQTIHELQNEQNDLVTRSKLKEIKEILKDYANE